MLSRDIESSRSLIGVLEDIASRHEVSPAQVALNWVIQRNGDAVVTIPAATKVQQAVENAAAMTFALTKDDLSRLDEASRVAR